MILTKKEKLRNNFNYAIIKLDNDEIIQGPIKQWKRSFYNTIKVKINDRTYYSHLTNIILIHTYNNHFYVNTKNKGR